MALPSTSAKRSRLLPEIVDDCSCVGPRLSPRNRAVIQEMKESVYALKFLGHGCICHLGSCEKVEYSILSTDLAPPALHRIHFVISYFRPSDSESSEAALRRLLASRAIGGYSVTCDDPTPGLLTVFQLSRLARPQDASSAPYFVQLSSFISAQQPSSFLPGYRWARLFVTLIQSSQHSRRRNVGFVRDLVKAGSVEFVDTAVEHVGLFFGAKKAVALRFILDARSSNRHFLNPQLDSCSQVRELRHVAFQEAPEDAQNWFVGSAVIKNAFHQMRIPDWLQALLCSARCSRIQR